MQRAGIITAVAFAVLSALLSLAMAAEWVRSYRLAEIAQRTSQWQTTGEDGEPRYNSKAYFVGSSRGAIRVRYTSSISMHPPGYRRPLSTRPTTFPARVRPTTRRAPRPQFYRLPTDNGWYRDIPATEIFGRDRTTWDRLIGFHYAPYVWARDGAHSEGWLLGFPDWVAVLIFGLYPSHQLYVWLRSRRKKLAEPAG